MATTAQQEASVKMLLSGMMRDGIDLTEAARRARGATLQVLNLRPTYKDLDAEEKIMVTMKAFELIELGENELRARGIK